MRFSLVFSVLVLFGCNQPEQPVSIFRPSVELAPVQEVAKPSCVQTEEALKRSGIVYDPYVVASYMQNTRQNCVVLPSDPTIIVEILKEESTNEVSAEISDNRQKKAGLGHLIQYAQDHPISNDSRGIVALGGCFMDRFKSLQCPIIRPAWSKGTWESPVYKGWSLDFAVLAQIPGSLPWANKPWMSHTRFLVIP